MSVHSNCSLTFIPQESYHGHSSTKILCEQCFLTLYNIDSCKATHRLMAAVLWNTVHKL